MKTVIKHLRAAALLHKGDGPTDRQLLESFLSRRESAAFEALLVRHGPMVLGVCRRILRNAHDAEDAFQATFLVLVRKAASLRSRDLLASWLYGVAYRTALKARSMNAKRRARERRAGEMPHSEPTPDEELLAQLDHELNRLPDKYRVPVILCELEGKSRKEVAGLLGVPEGTLSWRLAQAKKILARRLSRYGTLVVAALLAEGAASACLPLTLRTSTVEAVLNAGAVPAQVLALTEGVMKVMLLTKLKMTACFAMLALLAGAGATGLTYRAGAQEPKQETGYRAALVSRPQADDLESLRLEIDALRKELRAMRERVKALENEVGTQRDRNGPQGKGIGGAGKEVPRRHLGGNIQPPDPYLSKGRPMELESPALRKGVLQQAADPVSDAEAALKKLRQDPSDKQAAEALERALRRLKEREKRQPPTEVDSGVKR